jgi:hypothetical protein
MALLNFVLLRGIDVQVVGDSKSLSIGYLEGPRKDIVCCFLDDKAYQRSETDLVDCVFC